MQISPLNSVEFHTEMENKGYSVLEQSHSSVVFLVTRELSIFHTSEQEQIKLSGRVHQLLGHSLFCIRFIENNQIEIIDSILLKVG